MRRTASQARGIFRREDALHRLRLDGLQLELQVRKWRQHRRGSVGVGSSRGDRGRGADGGISRGRRSCRTAARCGARRWKQRARVGKGARGDKDTLSLAVGVGVVGACVRACGYARVCVRAGACVLTYAWLRPWLRICACGCCRACNHVFGVGPLSLVLGIRPGTSLVLGIYKSRL